MTKIANIWNYKECVTVELANGLTFRVHRDEVNSKSKLLKKITTLLDENQKQIDAKTKKQLDGSLAELKELEGQEIDDRA